MSARTKFRLQVTVTLIALLTGLQYSPDVRADDRAASAGMWNVMAVEMNGRQIDPKITAMIEVAYREDGPRTVLFEGMALGSDSSHAKSPSMCSACSAASSPRPAAFSHRAIAASKHFSGCLKL
jgi:hypothetical protein